MFEHGQEIEKTRASRQKTGPEGRADGSPQRHASDEIDRPKTLSPDDRRPEKAGQEAGEITVDEDDSEETRNEAGEEQSCAEIPETREKAPHQAEFQGFRADAGLCADAD
jgi:hypothetical protein